MNEDSSIFGTLPHLPILAIEMPNAGHLHRPEQTALKHWHPMHNCSGAPEEQAKKGKNGVTERRYAPPPITPFMASNMHQPNSNMRPLIRMLAVQAVKNWLIKNSDNGQTSKANEINEGNDLRTV